MGVVLDTANQSGLDLRGKQENEKEGLEMSIAEKIMATYPQVKEVDVFVNVEHAEFATVVTNEARVIMFNLDRAGELQGEYLDGNEWKTLPADDEELHFELGLI